MNENINLCELLKGHEGEIFYSPIYGEVEFDRIDINSVYPICVLILASKNAATFSKKGKYDIKGVGECMLFPSKDQRDWNKWAEEQKPKAPKTWNEIKGCNVEVWQAISHLDYGSTEPILKSAIALLKIHQLIEVGYGGNITKEEWRSVSITKWTVLPYWKDNIIPDKTVCIYNPVAFHTQQQRDEFLSYPENIQLVKDYVMI